MNHRYSIRILSLFLLACPLMCLGEEIALYDNTHLEAKAPPQVPASAPAPFFTAGDTHGAIQFYTGDADNVSSVAMTLQRTGTPGGKLVFEVWSVDANNRPGESVGVLGELEVDSIPTELSLVSVAGSVAELNSKTRYYLVFRMDGVDLQAAGGPSKTIHVAPLFAGNHAWAGPGTQHPPEGEPLEELLSYTNGRWQTLSSQLGAPPGWQHARITAACPNPEPLNIDISEAVAVTWDSEAAKTYQIHRSSDMETWEVAIDAIQGTGERMMQAFVREETEVFYRVEVLE